MRNSFDRRRAMEMALLAGASTLLPAIVAASAATPRVLPKLLPAQYEWTPVPPQAPATEGIAQADGAKLYYWDTGGPGEVILLMHPLTGSALVWGYQQPVFAKAGYRVIAYSRRGFARSETGALDHPSTAIDDINAVLAACNVDTFHMVGTAGGAFIIPDYAQSHPGRLLSMAITCSQAGVTEPSYRAKITGMNPAGMTTPPASYRELGPSYRAANPAGRAAWERLEEHSLTGAKQVGQPPKNRIDFVNLATIKTPALVLSGSADLAAPPSLMLEMASHLPNVETAILSESGHSGYWEQPLAFNAAVLDFVGRHKARR